MMEPTQLSDSIDYYCSGSYNVTTLLTITFVNNRPILFTFYNYIENYLRIAMKRDIKIISFAVEHFLVVQYYLLYNC